MKIRLNNVKLTQIRNSGLIKDEQLSNEKLSNGYTKANGMEENDDSSLPL